MVKLVETSAAEMTLPEDKTEAYLWDSAIPGFGIRLRKGGKPVYVLKYRIGQQQRKMTFPIVRGQLAKVREAAATVILKAKLGQDTQGDKKAASDVRNAVTFGALVERYIDMRRDALKPRTIGEMERHLRRQCVSLHGMAVEAVTRRDLAALIDQIAKDNSRMTADCVKASLSGFFAWCIERSYRDDNPAMGIKRRATGGSRERVLSEAELVAIWKACEEDEHGAILKLLMLTGQRRDEIGSLTWNEVDPDKRQIVLPGSRTKNKREHIVPLSDAAMAILEAIPQRGRRALVFGRGQGGFGGWSHSKARLDKRLGEAVKPWRVHDLRRTFATLAAEHDFGAPHIIEAMLNHQSGSKSGVAGTYNRANHERGKRVLADRFGEHITALVAGRESNIVALRG
jgi:integrase